jgi:hypothetical protein
MASPAQRLLLALGLLATLAGLGVGVYYALQRDGGQTEKALAVTPSAPATPPPDPVAGLFKDARPDAVLVLSGPMHGYLQPCGCSRPQVGGLERRSELVKRLQARGWPVALADLGDLAPKHMPGHLHEQDRIKYETALQTLQQMGYAAVGLGLTEIALPLEHALALAQNWQPPFVLAANLNDKEGRFPDMFRGWAVQETRPPENKTAATPPQLRVGYIGLVGTSVADKAKERDASLVFDPVDQVLPRVLEQVQQQKPDLLVLLFQGLLEEARQLAKQYPQFHVILAQDEYDTPTVVPKFEGKTLLVGLGYDNKGKYVGLVGVTRKPEGFGLQYKLLELGEAFELPDAETNPARELMRDYVLRVHQGNFLAKWAKGEHEHQRTFPEATYVGAEACKDCHRSAYATWSKSKHSLAYENLAKYGRPTTRLERKNQPPLLIGRHHDPECIRCHTTGFDYRGGFVSAETTPRLGGNGCENCHGPASLHVQFPKEKKYSAPLHLTAGKPVEMKLCRKCHDGDNDPHFNWETYWPKIRHGLD